MKIVLFANTDWYLYNFRRSLAEGLRRAGHEPVLLSPPGEYGERLRALGFRWEPLPMQRRSLNPLREAALLAWLWRFLRRERPALVHGFTIKCAVYGALAARLAGVPARVGAIAGLGYVFTSRDALARVLRTPVRLLLRLAFGGRGARVVVQNRDDAAAFADARLVAPDTLRLVEGSGVDLRRFRPRDPAAPAPGVPTVLLVSRLLKDKGVREFVAAARRLREDGRRLRCVLAGAPDPGNPAAIGEAELAAWRAEGVVDCIGHVEDMPALLAGADIVVLPSHREGLPRALIEAAACALPLVTTDAPGCREVVSHELDGLLVPVGDAAALADAIARLLDDPALARRLGEAARRKVQARFDERSVVARTLAVYAELLPAGFALASAAPEANRALRSAV